MACTATGIRADICAVKGKKFEAVRKKYNKIRVLYVDINYLVSVYLFKITSEVPLPMETK
jgi:hypothetical protein